LTGRVYIETTIPSLYHDNRGDPETIARRRWTRRWWDRERDKYELVTSSAVLEELRRGEFDPLSRSRQIAAFHTPAAMREMLGDDLHAVLQALQETPNDHPRLWPYQVEANEAIEKAIAERKRALLVAMATGTGKTFCAVNQAYRLMKSGVARRILFLVDRRALAAQAVRSFAAFEPEPGQKFDQIYEVYSNRFQTGDFGEGDAFDAKVLPTS
jgi:type I restriction enzyme, R subunit